MTRLVQIVPREGVSLFSEMVGKVRERTQQGRGTFSPVKHKGKKRPPGRAKWSHAKFNGWVKLERTEPEVVMAEVKSLTHVEDQWQLFHAFLGWLDREFAHKILNVNIQYRD